MVSFPDPHHPFNPPGKYWDMYAPSDFPPPEAYSRNDWMPPAHVQAILEHRESGRANLAGMNTIGVSAREAQEARALTCGMIACIDDAVGRVLRALDGSGRREDTVVIFTSDHGDHLGDHRLLLKGAEQYQGIVRVPFIWSDPRAGNDRHRAGALASTIDISATILDRASIEPYAGMQGRSLLPVMQDDGARVRDAVFIQYDHQAPSPGSNLPPRVHTLHRRALAAQRLPAIRLGRALRPRQRSGGVRQPVGFSRAYSHARAADGAAGLRRDRAHRSRAVAHPARLTGSLASATRPRQLFMFGSAPVGIVSFKYPLKERNWFKREESRP